MFAIPVLEMNRPRGAKDFTPNHTASKWQDQTLSPGSALFREAFNH